MVERKRHVQHISSTSYIFHCNDLPIDWFSVGCSGDLVNWSVGYKGFKSVSPLGCKTCAIERGELLKKQYWNKNTNSHSSFSPPVASMFMGKHLTHYSDSFLTWMCQSKIWNHKSPIVKTLLQLMHSPYFGLAFSIKLVFRKNTRQCSSRQQFSQKDSKWSFRFWQWRNSCSFTFRVCALEQRWTLVKDSQPFWGGWGGEIHVTPMKHWSQFGSTLNSAQGHLSLSRAKLFENQFLSVQHKLPAADANWLAPVILPCQFPERFCILF